MSNASLSANIKKLYGLSVFRWFLVAMPIIVPFYRTYGLTLQQIFLLQGIFSLTALTLDIPFGYFADRVGRKISICLGMSLAFLGFLTYSFSYHFAGFAIAEFILGIGSSLVSGADSALLYDTLAALQKTGAYKKVEGQFTGLASFSEALASIIGGLAVLVSIRLPVYLEAGAIFFAIPFALSLKEVRPLTSLAENRSFWKILQLPSEVRQEVKWLIIYSAVVSASTLTFVWFIQPYFAAVHLPLAWFGVIWAVLQLSVGLFSFYAYRIEGWLGKKTSLLMLISLSALAFFLLGGVLGLAAMLFMFLPYFVRGINEPVLKDYINQLVPSSSRATILSVKSWLARLLFAVIGPLAGYAADRYSLSTALMLSGATFLILGIIPLLFLKRYKVF